MAYNDINANKLVNKESLLQLCNIIKGELANVANVSGGSSSNLPTAPANDGTYMLKCVVSSGTAAYAWENVVVGGSY